MAVKSIANKCDAIYVIGGENSSNSIRLVEVAKKSGCRNNFLVSDINSDFELLTTNYDVYKERSASTFELFDSIESPNIHRVYPHTLFCDNQIKGRCVTHNKEDVFYADDDHPSAKGSEMIVELIMEQIENAEASIRGN